MNAPLQSNRAEWNDSRIGRFTASTNNKLLTYPKSLKRVDLERFAHLVEERFRELKSGPRKGQTIQVEGFSGKVLQACKDSGIAVFGETALDLVATKASEVLAGKVTRRSMTYPMKRGTVLESAMVYLLGRHWQQVDKCQVQTDGELWYSTPDGLLMNGEPAELKCPALEKVVRFADEVPDGDWEAMKEWNPDYAMQLATQAKTCGSEYANIIYCTDELKTIPVTEEEIIDIQGHGLHDEFGGVMGEAMQRLFDETGSMFSYSFNDAHEAPGFTFIARRFRIPEEDLVRLESALTAAIVARDTMVIRVRPLLHPTKVAA